MNNDEFGSDTGEDISNDVDNDTASEEQAFSEMDVEAVTEAPEDTSSDVTESFEIDLGSEVDDEGALAVDNSAEIGDDDLGEIDSELLADIGTKDVEDEEGNYDDVKAALEEYDYDTSDYGRGNKSFNAESVAEITGTSSSEAAEAMHAARDDAVKSGELTRGAGPGEEHPSSDEVEAYSLDSIKDLSYQLDEMADADEDSGE